MKQFFKIIPILLFSISNVAHAQLVTKNDTISGTPLITSMDKNVAALLENLEEKCATGIRRTDEDSPSRPVRVATPEKELSKAEICRRNPRIMGYKIQLAVVKSNEEAREVGLFFRRRFPNMKVEIDASLRPNYKVMAGSYLSKQSAASDLSKIKPHFKSAMAVQYRVFCVEAK